MDKKPTDFGYPDLVLLHKVGKGIFMIHNVQDVLM